MSGKAGGGDHRLRRAVIRGGEHARVDEPLAQRRAAARAGGERVVREVGDISAQEGCGLERRALTGSQDARAHGAVERIGNVGRGGGAVAERAEHELGVLERGRFKLRTEVCVAETVRPNAVAVSLFIGVGDIRCAPLRHIGEGMSGGAGERGTLFTKHTDEHDERLDAGGDLFQLVAAADAAARAAEKRERFERVCHRVVVGAFGRAEGIAAAVAHNSGFGRAGEQRRGVLGDEIAVVRLERAAARKLRAVGHIHDCAGGERGGQLARKRDDLQAR